MQVSVPWAAARSRFTLLLERWAIEALGPVRHDRRRTLAAAAVVGRTLPGIMQRAVARGRARTRRVIPALAVDEKAFKKGPLRYMTVVCDAQGGCVEYVAEEAYRRGVERLLEELERWTAPPASRLSSWMWPAYINSTLEHVPQANGEDRLRPLPHHDARVPRCAVDTVRKQEHRQLVAENDERLKGTKYLVALQQRESARAQACRVQGAVQPGTQGGPCLGDQGGTAFALALPVRGLGAPLLQALVFLGYACTLAR